MQTTHPAPHISSHPTIHNVEDAESDGEHNPKYIISILGLDKKALGYAHIFMPMLLLPLFDTPSDDVKADMRSHKAKRVDSKASKSLSRVIGSQPAHCWGDDEWRASQASLWDPWNGEKLLGDNEATIEAQILADYER